MGLARFVVLCYFQLGLARSFTGSDVKISKIIEIPSIRMLLFLHEKREVRYTDLTKLISSRGTLALTLNELDEEKLIQRRVVTTKPIQSYYSLTMKGEKVAKQLNEIKQILD